MAAGFATLFRSWGMPASARWVNEIGVVLILSATVMSLFVLARLVAVIGFLLTACWALLAVALVTDSNSVRLASVMASRDHGRGRSRPDSSQPDHRGGAVRRKRGCSGHAGLFEQDASKSNFPPMRTLSAGNS